MSNLLESVWVLGNVGGKKETGSEELGKGQAVLLQALRSGFDCIPMMMAH